MDMANSIDDFYLKAYRHAQSRYGNHFGVTLWANKQSQETRFRIMTELVYLGGKRILDVGCSRGDLASYLLDHDIHYSGYTGIDALPEIVSHARSRNLARCEFMEGDVVHQPALMKIGSPQIVVISGTLNTMDDETAIGVLESAWSSAGEALVFNFLSDTAMDQTSEQSYPARRLPTLKLLNWSLSRTWSVQFRQDYFESGHDATIFMRKAR